MAMAISEKVVLRASGRRKVRLLAVAGAVLVAEAVWVAADLVLGIHLRAPAGGGSATPWDIGPLTVAGTCALFSLVGWGLLALLERLTSHARTAWALLAVLALLASLSMPLGGTGVTAANRMVLVLMHLLTAAVVIPMLYRTSPEPARRSGS